jgi:hypothetical protein
LLHHLHTILATTTNTLSEVFLRQMMAVPGSASRQQQVPVLNLTKPIIIDRSALIGHHEVAPNEAYIRSGLEIVPWKPVAQALAIQIFAAFVERWETENQHKSDCVSGPCFEFQAQQTQTILEAALSMGNPTSSGGATGYAGYAPAYPAEPAASSIYIYYII